MTVRQIIARIILSVFAITIFGGLFLMSPWYAFPLTACIMGVFALFMWAMVHI